LAIYKTVLIIFPLNFQAITQMMTMVVVVHHSSIHPGPLSLAIPQWVDSMSTEDSPGLC